MLAANPIALTHWRLFRRGAMMPALLLFGGGAVLAVVAGLWGTARPGATADIARTLLGWQLVALVAIPPLFAVTTLSRARQRNTLATDRNSPVRPRQLLLGYLSSALVPAAVVGLPGLLGITVLSTMSGDEAHAGWFVSQVLAASTGGLLALCATVGLLVAQKSRAAIAAGGALAFMAFSMGFDPSSVTGLFLPSSLIVQVAYESSLRMADYVPQLIALAVATQLAVAGFAWLAGVRALDPRRDRRAMRMPWLGMVATLWALQLGYVVAIDAGGWSADGTNLAMLPITAVLLLGSSVDQAAWSRAIRTDGTTRGVSLVPFALGLAAIATLGLLAVAQPWAGTDYNGDQLTGVFFGSTLSIVTLAVFADASTLLASRTRNLLFAALAFGLGLVPFMIAVLTGDDELMLLSPFVALPALMFDTRGWDGDTVTALVSALVFLGIAIGIRQHAVGQARSAPQRVVGER